jgi:hypothetical protein
MGVSLTPIIFVLALSLLVGAVYTSVLLSRMERDFRKVCCLLFEARIRASEGSENDKNTRIVRMRKAVESLNIPELTLVALKKLPKGVPYEEEAA